MLKIPAIKLNKSQVHSAKNKALQCLTPPKNFFWLLISQEVDGVGPQIDRHGDVHPPIISSNPILIFCAADPGPQPSPYPMD